MDQGQTTCWTMIRGAADGDELLRQQFADAYTPVVRVYLQARWMRGPLRQDVDDAVQEVFIECFRDGGVIERADPARPGGFRAFLFGVVRNVARRWETRRSRRESERDGGSAIDDHPDEAQAERLSRVFDRHWARRVMREAAEVQQRHANAEGDDARRRVELLRLRFAEGLPIRDIATRWALDTVHVHREYARARREFREALEEVIRIYHPGPPESVAEECTLLLTVLSAAG